MRFLNKYDLQEPITRGPVQVYEVAEPGSGLRRLIHITQWKEMPDEISTLQILEQFRQMAPDPPGIILDAGRVEEENQIYLVTSFPSDPLSVQRWINSYMTMSGQGPGPAAPSRPVPAQPPTHSTTAAPPGAAPDGRQAPAAKGSEDQTVWTRHEPGAFTKEFLATLEKSRAMEPPKPPVAEPANEPGEFTREFLALSSNAGKEDSRRGGSRTDASGLLRNVDVVPPAPASPPAASAADGKPGEFTRFFRGYSGTAPEPGGSAFTPLGDGLSGAKPEGGKEAPGEFTKMFGKIDLTAPPVSQEEPRVTGLNLGRDTHLESTRFGPDAAVAGGETEYPATRRQSQSGSGSASPSSRSPEAWANASPSFEPAWKGEPATALPVASPPSPQSPRSRIESQPGAGNSFVPAWKEDEQGTTRLMTPASTPQPPPAAVPQGPSEFTRIISATSIPGGGPAPPPPTPPAGGPPVQVPFQPQVPVVTVPHVSTPVPAAPPVPPVPPAPAMYAPPAPSMQAPPLPAPAPPSAAKPAPKPVSYLPLIITMNVLLLVAIAVVLYFALRSHH